MMISMFCENEIRCWVDMLESGFPPQLYMFNIEGNKVNIHMEILTQGKSGS